ncbi:MAG: hypothetical protein ABR616_18010 [Dermatophilaceae bacterium]|nr:hypothetical protein [Intrasporangiaceae bacterium]
MQALDAARHLAEAGVPIFLARAHTNKLGFKLPEGWEKTEPDPRVVEKWKPGMAICAVMGHVVDCIDVDPRNGGTLAALEEALGGELPTVYGVQDTPSGGQHYLVASLGVRKLQNVVPGVDLQAGNEEGVGRGFIFIAPTMRESKLNGEQNSYVWQSAPDLGALLLEDDESGEALVELVESRHGNSRGKVDKDGSYEGSLYSELDDEKQKEADELVAGHVKRWGEVLARAAGWPEGYRDEKGRGWEALSFQSAWALAKMAACPWMGIDETGAELFYHEILPPEIADNEDCSGKWYTGIVEKAEGEPVDVPPWVSRGSVEDDFGHVRRPPCDATNEALVSEWLDNEVGTGPMSGMFRRGTALIFTPRVGEDGYIPPKRPLDYDGPVQVQRLSSMQFANRIDALYQVFRYTAKTKTKDAEQVPMVFRRDLAERALTAMDTFPNLRDLHLVSHTPLMRPDGTVLDTPGYDDSSGALYLPESGLKVEPVPEEPTEDDVRAARKLVLGMISDFPFVTDHDRANYLGCLLIPLIRLMVPPPYKMLIIGAPQRGSGKSLLALLMRLIHGGVFRSEIPREEDERRKVITSILDTTSAPIVQFDNVSGALKSSTMDGLLTSATWSDRRLGVQKTMELPNDRVWVVTGNNIHIGGDMDRRVLWSTINAKMEHPEDRSPKDFKIPNLESWVNEHRGEVISALLTWVRAWVVAGMPADRDDTTSDSFGDMTAVLRGIFDVVGIQGVLGDRRTAPLRSDPEAEEMAEFLQAVYRSQGDAKWTARELMDRIKFNDFDGDAAIREDELPLDLGDKIKNNFSGSIKSLGRWLSHHKDRVNGGLVIKASGSSKGALAWQVVQADQEGG